MVILFFRMYMKSLHFILLLLIFFFSEISTKLSVRERRDAWDRLPIVKYDTTPNGYELAFVNVIWRHGDRSATSSMVGDKVKEDEWTFGGGGYGELSPIGMQQHYELGKIMYDRYAKENKYLSSTFKAKEIYVHSTDKNRTIISAMSNLVGMYSRPDAKSGNDYPALTSWPQFFVPIAIHTEYGTNDHIGDPATPCPRQDDLWKLVQKTNDYDKAVNNNYTQETLEYLRVNAGGDEKSINFENVYKIWDNMLCESIHFPSNVSTWYPWYTKEIDEKVDTINNWGIDLVNGIMEDNIIDGYDLSYEIQTIRGGPLINDIVAKANGVVGCYKNKRFGENTNCNDKDHFFQNLKYHVISAHDTTIGAYLTVLGAKTKVEPDGGYPLYAAAVATEFFIDTNNENKTVFRLIYHDGPDSDGFRVITQFVNGCNGEFCSYDVLQDLANKFVPPGGIDNLCLQRIK